MIPLWLYDILGYLISTKQVLYSMWVLEQFYHESMRANMEQYQLSADASLISIARILCRGYQIPESLFPNEILFQLGGF